MSFFGRNIRKIRNAKNISQTTFADLFNLKRGSIGAYEEGRAEAKIDTIIEIAEYFQLSLDQLLRKELTINEIYHIEKRNKNYLLKTSKQDEELKTPLILETNMTEFIKKSDNVTFLQNLPFLNIYGCEKKDMAFECVRESLVPNNMNLITGDILIAEPFDILSNLVSDYDSLFICICQNQIVLGRLFETGDAVFFESNHLPVKLKLNNEFQKVKLWKVKKLLTDNIKSLNYLEHKLSSIEKKIDDLIKIQKNSSGE